MHLWCEMDCEYDDILKAQTGDREAFVEAFLKLHTLRDAGRFRPWLRTLTLNVCRMWHRKKKRECADGLLDLLLGKEKGEREAQLSGYFAGLSDTHRMALALHYWEGLSYEEMARFLEVPIGTVMSRLSRARDALKDAMGQSEGLVMDGESDLQVEVDAEIEVLLKLFGDDVNSMDRLSVVLEKSPDRFRQVVRQVEDGATVEQVALLVRHFGQPAVEATLGCYFDGEAEDKAKAFAVLLELINSWVGKDYQKPHLMPMLPGAYLVLDVIVRSAHSFDAQITLLIDLLEENTCGSIVRVLACVLRGYGDRAYSALLDRFMAFERSEDRSQICMSQEALRLFGSRFCGVLLESLRSADRRQILLGLRGVGALVGNIMYDNERKQYTEYHYFDQRIRGLLWASKMDIELIHAMTKAVAHLLSHQDHDIRIWAIEVLKRLPAGSHLAGLRACLNHDDKDTRIVATGTLAELGDLGAVKSLIELARSSDGMALRKVIEALGQLRAQEAQPLLEEMIDHPDRTIREAVILALGNVGNEDARRKLCEMIGSDDAKIARLAARAIFDGKQNSHRPKASALKRARLQKVRGDGQPFHPWLHRSLVTAVW
ncbi:MAG: HEAT repeat domain-containing protein, partial [Candidatus Latescibacteria bacterium]|nr:HEAT repeat domain-containing protein [Candidatus Latescibacterota bacterium]